tara:strand:- start:15524 stop:15709 length:186 start_codon:yes stop_codon:yes gene_type:complete
MDLNNPTNFLALFALFVPFIIALAIGIWNLILSYFHNFDDDLDMFDDKDYPYERIDETEQE